MFKEELLNALKDDLNISKALAVVDQFISTSNELLDNNPKDKSLKYKINGNIELIEKLLGVGGKDAYNYFQLGVDEKIKKEVEELIKKRDEAKREKRYEEADKIREQIKSLGISIQDTANGTIWEVANV
jgi:cysteinyl-tRNA synthetase